MRRLRLSLLAAGLIAGAFPLAARAQSGTRIEIRTRGDGTVVCYRDGRQVDCDTLRSERDRAAVERAERERDRTRDAEWERAEARLREREREADRVREAARERARVLAERREVEARERAAEARRRTEEARVRAEALRERERARVEERLRETRRIVELSRERAREQTRERVREAQRRRSWRSDTRPRIGIGGGADVRRFDSVDRYSGQLGVDFRGWSGIGLRPEVVYAWTDRQRASVPSAVCATCLATFAPIEYRSRSQLLGVNLNATYAFLRGSPIRPYAVGGVGVLVTRDVQPVVVSSTPLSGLPGRALAYRTEAQDRTDIGLNAGAGLEFGRGPVRLFTEVRYYLMDRAPTRGFSGMLPITAGLRF